ncbi:MAG: ATP-binding protein [Cyclobacteriaceae bacterium]|nr:ATP-binding protein [Cyclobacteriaceae bacterium HetDA_MAG_MS6]
MTFKVAIVGPESTGKSELAQQLARSYQSEWVPEFARFYLDRLDRDYVESDLLEIAKGQLAWEDDKTLQTDSILLCDTNLIVIKIWSEHGYKRTDAWIEEQLQHRKYDFYLLTNIDLPWREDPQREHPDLRSYFLERYRDYLDKHHLPYAIVSGIEDKRTECAMEAIAQYRNSLI